MNGCIAQLFRDLGEIHMSCADQLFGGVDLKCGKIFNNAKITLFLKNLLKLRTPHQIVPTDLFDADVFVNVILQICVYAVENFDITFVFCGFKRFCFQRGFAEDKRTLVFSYQMNQHIFQKEAG